MTDLDWLARNVHEWHSDGERLCYIGNENGYPDPRWPMQCHPDEGFSREQWLTRRAELQCKPSWEGAPEWAEWLDQNCEGAWCWSKEKPIEKQFGYYSEIHQCCDEEGEVLGDWRDTLERRPVGMFNGTISDLYVNGERRMLPHEWTGPEDGLPPVGTECEADGIGGWHRVRILDLDANDAACRDLDTNELLWSSVFRPLRTEEDKAVERWCKDIEKSLEKFNVNIECSAAIKATIIESYRAGYRKTGEQNEH